MSNARSPREGCSTTIGTSGLTVPLLSLSTPYPFLPERSAVAARLVGTLAMGPQAPDGVRALGAGRPELARHALAAGLLAGRPELVARLRAVFGDRLGVLHQEVQR